jgi:hypothetical protein
MESRLIELHERKLTQWRQCTMVLVFFLGVTASWREFVSTSHPVRFLLHGRYTLGVNACVVGCLLVPAP